MSKKNSSFLASKVVKCNRNYALRKEAKRYSYYPIPYTELTIEFTQGGMMNSWPNESMAECHRLRIMEEVKQIRLEKLALKSRRRYRPRAFGRAMFNFGNWMISTGKQLRKRYEIPEKRATYEGMPKAFTK